MQYSRKKLTAVLILFIFLIFITISAFFISGIAYYQIPSLTPDPADYPEEEEEEEPIEEEPDKDSFQYNLWWATLLGGILSTIASIIIFSILVSLFVSYVKGMSNIVDAIERDEILTKAHNYEKALRYEDAIELFEKLELWDHAGRCRKLMREQHLEELEAYSNTNKVDKSVTIKGSVVNRAEINTVEKQS